MSLIDKIEISTRVTRTHNAYSVRVLVMTMPSDRERKRETEKKAVRRQRMVGGIAEIRWIVSRGWKRVLEPRPRHMSRIFIRGLPQSLRSQPSWPQTLATRAVPRHRPTSRPLCPDNSRRDAGIISAHCHRLIESGSEQNRSRQIAPTCPLPSNLPFRPKFRSRDANPIYRITSLEDLPLDFHSKLRIHDSSIFHLVQLFALFFLFFLFFRARYSKLRG